MKKIIPFILALFILAGCAKEDPNCEADTSRIQEALSKGTSNIDYDLPYTSLRYTVQSCGKKIMIGGEGRVSDYFLDVSKSTDSYVYGTLYKFTTTNKTPTHVSTGVAITF